MYGYEEQDLLNLMQEETEKMIEEYGYCSFEQLIRIAELAGMEEDG